MAIPSGNWPDFWIFLISCMKNEEFSLRKINPPSQNYLETSASTFTAEAGRGLFLNKLHAKIMRFLIWTIYQVLDIPLPWSFGVPWWTEMIPAGFLNNFSEDTGTSLILPKPIGPSSHGERNSQVMWSQIARGQPTRTWSCFNHTSSNSNLIISETFSCFSNYFKFAEWRLASSPDYVLEFTYQINETFALEFRSKGAWQLKLSRYLQYVMFHEDRGFFFLLFCLPWIPST